MLSRHIENDGTQVGGKTFLRKEYNGYDCLTSSLVWSLCDPAFWFDIQRSFPRVRGVHVRSVHAVVAHSHLLTSPSSRGVTCLTWDRSRDLFRLFDTRQQNQSDHGFGITYLIRFNRYPVDNTKYDKCFPELATEERQITAKLCVKKGAWSSRRRNVNFCVSCAVFRYWLNLYISCKFQPMNISHPNYSCLTCTPFFKYASPW